MADLKENQMSTITNPTYIRCVDSAGNSRIVSSSQYKRSDEVGGQLSNIVMLQIASVSTWERFAAMCVVGSYNGSNHMLLTITGTKADEYTPIIHVKAFGGYVTSNVKVICKVEGNKLCVYLYSSIEQGSQNPTVVQSSHPVRIVNKAVDLSSYTEIPITSV